MQIRSIQTKISLLAGLCVFAATAAVALYGTVAAQRSAAYVNADVKTLASRKIEQSLQNLASTEAGNIRTTLDEAFDAARNMARAFEELAAGDDAGITTTTRREIFNRILLNVLKNNPSFNGTYSAWEPDSLDGADENYKMNHAKDGSDSTGRFLPYWTRDASGHIAIQPLVEYDSRALHSNGVMKGGWYIGPQSGGGESLLAPLPYVVQGKDVYLATMSVPIMIDGKFAGVAGADYNLDFVQKLAERVKASLFGGKASVAIVSSDGLVIASSEHPEAIGQSWERVNPAWKSYFSTVKDGRAEVVSDADNIVTFAPITLGRTKSPWSVIVQAPTAVAMAEVSKLAAALDDRNRTDTFLQVGVGILIAAVGVLAMWFVARSMSAPITAMTAAMRRLAEQDFATEVPGVDRVDEIGRMAATVQIFKQNGLKLQDTEAEAARQRQLAEAERARAEAAKAEVDSSRQRVVASVADGLERLSQGDLTSRLRNAFPSEFEKLRGDFNSTAESLAAALRTIAHATSGINSSSDQIARASDDLSQRTEQQAASLEETAASLNTVTSTVKDMAAGANQAAVLVANARTEAENSGSVVEQAVSAMGNIKSSSDRVAQIIGVIDEIAFQTNLLALNAGVEAARAGEAGRGFAVVASEVRGLAQRSAEAAKEIKALISQSAEEVETGVELVSRTGEALKSIIVKVLEIDRQVRAISTSANDQAVSLNEINSTVGAMDRVVQENAAMVGESSSAANSLKSESSELALLVGRFRLTEGAAREAGWGARAA